MKNIVAVITSILVAFYLLSIYIPLEIKINDSFGEFSLALSTLIVIVIVITIIMQLVLLFSLRKGENIKKPTIRQFALLIITIIMCLSGIHCISDEIGYYKEFHETWEHFGIVCSFK